MNYGISFLLTSFIVREISAEAYGFTNLCNNIVNYATLITIVLNSVAGRFITIEIHRGNKERANKYFSSTVIANLIICSLLFIIFIQFSISIDQIFDIPDYLVSDVRVLFLLVAFNLVLNVFTSVFTVSTFITNNLYLSSLANAIGIVVRSLSLFLFMKFDPNIRYVGVATILGSTVIFLMNIYFLKKLCPDFKIRKSDFSISYVKELISSGIWNTVSKLSQILSDGFDLVITNIWIGVYAMGQLSIAYTIPTVISSFLSMIINVFNPQLTEYYAKGKKDEIIKAITLNMKMTAFFGNVIFFGFVAMGKDFFSLFVPTANIDLVYVLAIFAISSLLSSSIVSPLSNVFLLTNKLKVNSVVWFFVSVFDAILLVILLNTTSMGIYAVAFVSKIVGTIVNLTFLPLYASRCLSTNPLVFYKLIFRYTLTSIFLGVVIILCRELLGEINSWSLFVVRCAFLGLIGFIVNYTCFLQNEERVYLKNVIISKIWPQHHVNHVTKLRNASDKN